MASRKTKTIWLAAAAAALLAAVWFSLASRQSPESARAGLLGFVPPDATSVVFVDADQLRASPFLAQLYSWAPARGLDSDYAKFVQDTGFAYERDLSRIFIAVANRAGRSRTLVIAEGRFDRKKIEAYLGKPSSVEPGGLTIYPLPARESGKPAWLAFLSENRVAISDAENLSAIPAAAPDRAEWQTRFDRLSGSPFFAVIRQDPAVQGLAANRSPELAAFLRQLPWISLAGRPEGDLLRVVAEGETLTATAAAQLRDFLQGIQVLAAAGLNDPGLRQKMDPEERAAYRELLQATEIEKIARGDASSVRIVVPVTMRFLKVAKIPAPAAVTPAEGSPAPGRQKRGPRAKPGQEK